MKQLRDRMIALRDIAYSNRSKRGFMSFCQSTPMHFYIVLEVGIAQLSGKRLNFERLVQLLDDYFEKRQVSLREVA